MSEGAEVSLATGRAGEGLTEQMNGVLRGDGQATESLPRSVASEQTAGDGMDPKAASEAERLPKGIDQRLVSLLAPVSFEAEQYRALRYHLEDLHTSAGLALIAVTSAAPGDGKTMTAINLAGALAQARDARVLLVEADIRRPSVALSLGLGRSTRPGLVDAIQDSSLPLENVVQRCPGCNLTVLPAGQPAAAPDETLKSERLAILLADARRQYDYVVLDAPPLVPLSDARILAKVIDGFLLVVAAHKTSRKLLEEALNVVDPSKVIGLVFNNDDRLQTTYYRYYSAYRQPFRRRNP
jgi:capsular exopolysaccharide synthesis family protein